MDQVKIGLFLKGLRNEHGITQEQAGEQFGVTGRTVSRWENGNNMPDISILIEMAEFYEVDIKEIINGERESKKVNNELKETVNMMAEYSGEDKRLIIKKIWQTSIVALMSLIAGISLIIFNEIDKAFYFLFVSLGCMFAVNIYSNKKYGELSKNRKYAIKLRLLIGICIFISAMLIIAIAFRFYAVKSIGGSIFDVGNFTEALSMLLISGGILLDIILIISIIIYKNKN